MNSASFLMVILLVVLFLIAAVISQETVPPPAPGERKAIPGYVFILVVVLAAGFPLAIFCCWSVWKNRWGRASAETRVRAVEMVEM